MPPPRAEFTYELSVESRCAACGTERDFNRADIIRAVTDADTTARVAVVEVKTPCRCGGRRVRVTA